MEALSGATPLTQRRDGSIVIQLLRKPSLNLELKNAAEPNAKATEENKPRPEVETHAKIGTPTHHKREMAEMHGSRSTQNCRQTTADKSTPRALTPSGATPLTHQRDGNIVTQSTMLQKDLDQRNAVVKDALNTEEGKRRLCQEEPAKHGTWTNPIAEVTDLPT